jgi:triosephosphate isomerase
MKKLYLVANWKSNKNRDETISWFATFAKYKEAHLQQPEKITVVCPPYIYLPQAEQLQKEYGLPLWLGAQDVSATGAGAFTGEVHAQQVKEYAAYVIIGHSERRQYFGENDALLEKKVAMALQEGLTPIYCVQGKDTFIPKGVTIVAYEPITAIGTGNPDTPENAASVAGAIKEAHPEVTALLYGGSVKPDNVATFTSMPTIDGVLVGGASLDPEIFNQLIHNT